ncbi:hypothetical protein [Nocardia paucivorans]|uniref:hypothetical protein n=1 Tax=Nocardia paucivorans TaxID=114259 RepID=UPI0012F7B667|nr:hypothetical protein [Nocardia paucivorans]
MRADRSRSSSKTRRPPEVLDRIQRSRERAKARRDAARQREQVIIAAVKRYIDAWQAIVARESKRDSDIEQLRRRITEVEAEAAAEIDRHRSTQAGVAATLREQGQSDDEIAELLEITPKEARRLLGLARTATKPTTTQPVPPPGPQSGGQKEPSPDPNTRAPGPARALGSKGPDAHGKPEQDGNHLVAGEE